MAREKVAVVGSGMAGLASAWALHNDPSGKFDVVVFEKGHACALDGYSYTPQGERASRIDIPMRVFSGHYYANLFKLVSEFNVPAKPRQFLFVFTRDGQKRPYFIHASNRHRLPPLPKPNSGLLDRLRYYALLLTVAACYAIFTIGVYWFPPKVSKNGKASDTDTIGKYCKRLWLPDFFLNDYLVPLFSSVATCSHEDFRDFPAVYITDYKKHTAGNDHNSVTTMQAVQAKLVSNGLPIKLRHPVTKLETLPDGSVRVTYVDLDGGAIEHKEVFAKVVTATSSHALANLYEPARPMASQLPICEAEVVVHTDYTIMSHLIDAQGPLSSKSVAEFTADDFFSSIAWINPQTSSSDILALQTRRSPDGQEWTEATHVHSSGLLVTVRPVIYSQKGESARESAYGTMNKTPRLPPAYVTDPNKIAHKAVFYRMLSSPYRRELIRSAFSPHAVSTPPASELGEEERLIGEPTQTQGWRNGDGNVYVTGSWPCDSLTLLENCVRTALKTAETLGAEVPFKVIERTEF